jgi:broad specificity phosphatase PhoE
MARIWLVRHAEAAAGWGDDPDPALSEAGFEQAEALARSLAPLGPMPICTSPLRRCQQTAAPLAARWGIEPIVDQLVGEIRSPTDDLAPRQIWLRDVMRSRWSELTDADRQWRDAVVAHVAGLTHDTVVVTHFVLTNAVVGAATGDDRVVSFSPANATVTVVETDAEGGLQILARGTEMASDVL